MANKNSKYIVIPANQARSKEDYRIPYYGKAIAYTPGSVYISGEYWSKGKYTLAFEKNDLCFGYHGFSKEDDESFQYRGLSFDGEALHYYEEYSGKKSRSMTITKDLREGEVRIAISSYGDISLSKNINLKNSSFESVIGQAANYPRIHELIDSVSRAFNSTYPGIMTKIEKHDKRMQLLKRYAKKSGNNDELFDDFMGINGFEFLKECDLPKRKSQSYTK